MIDKTYLESVCAAQSLPFSPELSEKLDQYAQLLVEWNEKMNLTAITEPNDIAVKHFADSLLLLNALDIPKNASLIDVGRHRRRFPFRSGWAGASGSESDSSG